MAINTVRGTQVYIKIGDGANPEVFTHPCLVNTKRGVKFNGNTNKVIVPDCDNPDDPAWTRAIKDGLNMSIDGSGKLDVAAVPMFDAWYRTSDTKNIQVWLGTKGYWQGAFVLSNWDVSGDRNDYADATIALDSDGVVPPFIPQA